MIRKYLDDQVKNREAVFRSRVSESSVEHHLSPSGQRGRRQQVLICATRHRRLNKIQTEAMSWRLD
jgi:hypothetical protein